MICDRRDPCGWVPYCGKEIHPDTHWTLCPHPRLSDPSPSAAEQFEAAWEEGWRPPDYRTLNERRLTTGMDGVIEGAARLLGEVPDDLKGRSRVRPLLDHRQVAFAVCRRVTGQSYPAIARAFNRDHTTIMHGIQRAENHPRLRPMVERIEAELIHPSGRA